MSHGIIGGVPKFYGSTTIGERGQIVVPADARHDLNMNPGTKIMVFGDPSGKGLMVMKAESVAEILARASDILNGYREIMKDDPTDND